MNLRIGFRGAVLATAIVASNVGIATDMVHGYKEASTKGGDPMAHTYSGKAMDVAFEFSNTLGGAVGSFATLGIVYGVATVNLPGIYAGEAIAKNNYPKFDRK